MDSYPAVLNENHGDYPNNPVVGLLIMEIITSQFLVLDFLDQEGGMILKLVTTSSSFLVSSPSRRSLENASGCTLMQSCKATKGLTQSEPCKNQR